MRENLKAILRVTFVPFMRLISPLFYRREYLRGRLFEGGAIMGWAWAWRSILFQKILGFNRAVPFPVSHRISIANWRNLEFHPDDLNNFQHFGCYLQNFSARIIIGRGTYIAPNVGLITANHDPLDPDAHLPGSDIVIGKSCWIGMNAVVLPGVVLGDHTVVGAGAVVSKSHPEGYCVLGGVPARKIKDLDRRDG